eukprot:jgi/Psemu1/323221/estExt_fgenesh1_pg.C_630006
MNEIVSTTMSTENVEQKHLNRFISKLFHIVDSDEPTACWVPGGKSFMILNVRKFSETVLPKYFKHNKFTSFVRQLNFYGFHKLRIHNPRSLIDSMEDGIHGSSTTNSEKSVHSNTVCFHHEFFQASEPDLLERIRRTTKQVLPAIARSHSTEREKEMESMKDELRSMKERMESMEEEFATKLERVKTDLEIDYLHRIKAIEVCYKDLATAIATAKELPSTPSLSSCSPQSPRGISRISETGRLVVPPLHGTTSANTCNILRKPNNHVEDYFAEQKLKLLSILNHGQFDNGRTDPLGKFGTTFATGTSSIPMTGQSSQETVAKETERWKASMDKHQQLSASSAYYNALRLIDTLKR